MAQTKTNESIVRTAHSSTSSSLTRAAHHGSGRETHKVKRSSHQQQRRYDSQNLGRNAAFSGVLNGDLVHWVNSYSALGFFQLFLEAVYASSVRKWMSERMKLQHRTRLRHTVSPLTLRIDTQFDAEVLGLCHEGEQTWVHCQSCRLMSHLEFESSLQRLDRFRQPLVVCDRNTEMASCVAEVPANPV